MLLGLREETKVLPANRLMDCQSSPTSQIRAPGDTARSCLMTSIRDREVSWNSSTSTYVNRCVETRDRSFTAPTHFSLRVRVGKTPPRLLTELGR